MGIRRVQTQGDEGEVLRQGEAGLEEIPIEGIIDAYQEIRFLFPDPLDDALRLAMVAGELGNGDEAIAKSGLQHAQHAFSLKVGIKAGIREGGHPYAPVMRALIQHGSQGFASHDYVGNHTMSLKTAALEGAALNDDKFFRMRELAQHGCGAFQQ